MFSISVVCASNETIDNANQNQDISISPEEVNVQENNPGEITPHADNASASPNSQISIENYSYEYAEFSGNANYDVGSVNVPVLQISVNNNENSPLQDYLDVSIDYNGNSYNVDNKNYYLTFNQQDDNSANTSNNPEFVSVSTSAKNNNLLLNVNFLNVSNQTINLINSNNIIGILWNMVVSIFNSLFK